MKLEEYLKLSLVIHKRIDKFKIEKEPHYKSFKNDIIGKYIDEIKKHNTEEQNKIIDNNLKTLKVTKVPILQRCFKKKFTSAYNARKNKIYLDYNVIDSLPHELIHMASTKASCNEVYSGFMQFRADGKELGRGINEGFTELLTAKYFNKKDISKYQLFETSIAKYITEIIDYERLKDMYFKADLESLIIELNKYDSFNNIITFIKNVDIVNHKENSKKEMLDSYLTLYKWKCIKLKNQYENKVITKEDYEMEVLDNARIYPVNLLVITGSTEPITQEMKEEVRRTIK